MLRYEALMLAIPEITQDEAKSIESQIEGVIVKAGGSVVSFERWGKYRLAYPVAKNEYGIYFLIRFEAEKVGTMLKDMQQLFAVRLNDIVMRNMVSCLDPKASLAYQRPHSLEEAPAHKEASPFLRDRMDGHSPRGNRTENSESDMYDDEEGA